MDTLEYQFINVTPEQSEILIALLSDIGFNAFQESEATLFAYIKEDVDDNTLNKLIESIGVSYLKSNIPETNWNEVWESEFDPVHIYYPESRKLFVNLRAHFHLPQPDSVHDIIVTPKMSFGTGHHATTYGMIENMSQINFENKSVIDFGTGTGVLAILAEKMGAAKVLAIDNDEWSIRNAAENFSINNCSRIQLIQKDSFQPEETADIILANINLNVIVDNLQNIRKGCAPGASIFFSGILSDDEPMLVTRLSEYGIKASKTYMKNNWIVVAGNLIE